MKAPWEELGVEPGCSDGDLKFAYASLLKQHRPDKDPEGFRRVRDAYEWMRQNPEIRKTIAQSKLDSATPNTSDATDSDDLRDSKDPGGAADPLALPLDYSALPAASSLVTSSDGSSPSEAVLESSAPISSPAEAATPEGEPQRTLLERVERKLKWSRRRADKEGEDRAMRILLQSWRAKESDGDDWDRLLVDELNREEGNILPLMNPADAVIDVEREKLLVAITMTRAFARRAAWPSVFNILDALEKHLAQHASPATATALIISTRCIALLDWKRAQTAANAAYPHLPEFGRQSALSDLERLIQAGKELGLLNAKDRSVLARCIATEKADATDETVQHAMRSVSYITAAPTAKTCLSEVFPEFAPKLRVSRVAVSRPAASRPAYNPSTSSSSGSNNYWWLIFVFISLTRLAGGCASSSSSYSPPPRYSPPPSYSPPRSTPNSTLTPQQRQALQKYLNRPKDGSTLSPDELDALQKALETPKVNPEAPDPTPVDPPPDNPKPEQSPTPKFD